MDDDLVVRVDGGFAAGIRRGGVRAWLGLPYAAPPLGERRWCEPQPVPAWAGVRAATAFAPQCLQPGRPADSVYAEYAGVQPMSEDCLYLNVWSAAPDATARLPVMVWIHGGAFQQGAGSNPVFVRGDLAQQGVVLVTLNYRLGPFGFLAHPDLSAQAAQRSGRAASGNYGLMDMIAALRWVQRRIAAFGGDPANVTLFGQSAGGASVIDLMAAPAARGLFQRAIAQSFGIAAMGGLDEAERQGAAFARHAGAADLAALRRLDAQALLDAYLRQDERFMPFADGHVLERPVLETFVRGEQAPVPLLIGWNADEGSTFGAAPDAEAFGALLRRRFGADAEAALRLYPAADDAQARDSSRRLIGDELFGWGAWRAAREHTRLAPTWVYHFEHPQPFAAAQRYREAAPASALGVFHSSEYPYVFGSTGVLTRDWGEDDARIVRLMQRHWLAFARSGRPAPGADADADVAWPPFDDTRPSVMRLATRPALIDVPRRPHLQFLDR